MKIWFMLFITTLTLYSDTTLLKLFEAKPVDQNNSKALIEILTNKEDSEKQSDYALSEEDLTSYQEILKNLRENPLNFISLAETYVDKSELFKKRTLLYNRIKANRNRGNNLAVMRDLITLDTLKVEQNQYQLFTSLAKNIYNFETSKIPQTIQNAQLKLDKINLEPYQSKVHNLDDEKSAVAQSVIKNYAALEKAYNYNENLLRYLEQNSKDFHREKSFITRFSLDKIINMVNRNSFIAHLNEQIKFLHIDAGRIMIFSSVILFFLLLKDLGRMLILYIIKKFLSYFKHEESSDIMVRHLHKLHRVISNLITLFGISLAIKVLYYPKEMSEFISVSLYLLNMFLIVFLLFRAAETLLEIFVQSKSKEKTKMRNELVNLFINITKVVIVIIALILFLKRIGIDVTGLVASLGVGGLAVALASKDTISNFFASVKIILEDAFHQGDWVETKDFQGFVVELGFTSTKIRTFDNALISIPNEKLASGYIKNWSKRVSGRRVKFNISLPYNSKRENIQNAVVAIRQMLQSHPDIMTDQKAKRLKSQKKLYRNGLFSIDDKYGMRSTLLVYLDELSPSTIDILVYAFTQTINWEEWLSIKQDVIYKIWMILEENDLEFAYPTQMLYHQEIPTKPHKGIS